jgi:hypothetical protein
MIKILVLTVVSIAALLIYLTAAVATSQVAHRRITARTEVGQWDKDDRYAVAWTLAIEIALTWLLFSVYFLLTTNGIGQTPGPQTPGLGWSIGLAITLGTIPVGLVMLTACGISSESDELTAQVIGVLWPYVLLTLAMFGVARLVFAGPARWGSVIADVPQRSALRAAQREKELAEYPNRVRHKEIEAGIEPLEEP